MPAGTSALRVRKPIKPDNASAEISASSFLARRVYRAQSLPRMLGLLIVLWPGQDELAVIIKIAGGVGDSLQEAGIKFETGLKLEIAHRDKLPNGESSFPFEFQC